MLHLTNAELVDRLDLDSTDPIIRRLVGIIKETSVLRDLEAIGMRPDDCTFEHEWDHLPPDEYILRLRDDIRYHQDEVYERDNDIISLQKEIDRLSTQSLVRFIADVKDSLEAAKMEEGRQRRIAEHEQKMRKEAEQKFEFWEKMNYGGKGRA